jgi:quinol monooxygenase YgiN
MIAARAERGCLTCSVSTEAGRQVGVRYVEEWINEEVLQRQLRSDRFASLATLMETATEAPSLEIQLPTGIRGLDYVEEVRGTA